jgi:hypothetical protein
MKLYKLHPTVKALEGAIIPEALCWIEETI